MSTALFGGYDGMADLFAGAPNRVATSFAAAAALTVFVAEHRRREMFRGKNTTSLYDNSYIKALAVASTVVCSVSNVWILIIDPVTASVISPWLSFLGTLSAVVVFPGTHAELMELKNVQGDVYKLYWMPVLFSWLSLGVSAGFLME